MYSLVFLFVLMNFCRLLWMLIGIHGLLILDKQRMDNIYGWLFWSSYLLGGENASPPVSNFDPFLFYRASNFDLVSMVYWNCETKLFFFLFFLFLSLKAIALNIFFFFGWPLNWLLAVMLWTSQMLRHESWPWNSYDKIHSVPFYVSIALFNQFVTKLLLAGPSWCFFL